VELERWINIADGFYAVSNLGNVKRIKPGRRATVGKILKPQFGGRYYHVRLGLGKLGIKMRTIHSLVAEAFLGLRPEGFQINHKDGNKLNNNIDNLEYITHAKNAEHAALMGLYPRGENQAMSKLRGNDVIEIKKRISFGEYCTSIARDFGVSSTAIYHIKNGTNWKHIIFSGGT